MTTMTEPGLRNLDQLQEVEDERQTPHGVTLALLVIGGATVVFGGLALGGRSTPSHGPKSDPLGELVSRHGAAAAPSASTKAADLAPKDVTFPQMLSDDPRPTTALAAVRPAGAHDDKAPVVAAAPPQQPPPPTDRLPVVPLPAQAVLEATSVVTRPRDSLTKAASDAAKLTAGADATPSAGAASAGHDGGYQLQVSSFHTAAEAEAFAEQLRARGHHAYSIEAHVPGRGTWYRVRIGPFPTQHAALQYRTAFEAREHVVPFVVNPEGNDKAAR